MAMVAVSRAVNGGAVLLVGLTLGAAGQIGDFGVLARAIAIAHLAAQFTDAGGLAAFTARSADPMTERQRRGHRMWLTRRVAMRAALLAPLIAAVASAVDVPLLPAVAVFGAVSAQRLAAELFRSDGRTAEYAVVAGLPSALWLTACLIVLVVGTEPTASSVTVLYAALVAAVGAGALLVVLAGGPAGSADGMEVEIGDGAGIGDRSEDVLSGRQALFVEGVLEAAVRNVDVILVTLVVGRDEAGLYAIASRLVAVAMTPLAAANGALAREYAERWANGGAVALSGLARPVARRITVLPALMTLVAGIVALVLGHDGGLGTVALVAMVLLASATVSTGAGSAGLLLGICRRELASARISAVAIAASVILLLALGWAAGLVPAAIGFASGVAAQNIAQAFHLRRHVGVVSHL